MTTTQRIENGKAETYIVCDDCKDVPDHIVKWKKMWRCRSCDEKRRRLEIEAEGTTIEEGDDCCTCQGCLFGVGQTNLYTVNNYGPYHRNCAIANSTRTPHSKRRPGVVRFAPPEEWGFVDAKLFMKLGKKISVAVQ